MVENLAGQLSTSVLKVSENLAAMNGNLCVTLFIKRFRSISSYQYAIKITSKAKNSATNIISILPSDRDICLVVILAIHRDEPNSTTRNSCPTNLPSNARFTERKQLYPSRDRSDRSE
jgi:hypothetical protein